MLNIDFHVHTAERSSCATASQTNQIQAAIAAGLHAIAITDHEKLVPNHELAHLNQVYAPFRILSGIEITADGEDWLVLGLPDQALETQNWTYPRLHQFVRSRGGVIILAHPYRYHAGVGVDLDRYTPDGVELHSNNIRAELIPQIKDLAEHLHISTLCNSDAHATYTIGRYYNIFDQTQIEPTALFGAIRSGSLQRSLE